MADLDRADEFLNTLIAAASDQAKLERLAEIKKASDQYAQIKAQVEAETQAAAAMLQQAQAERLHAQQVMAQTVEKEKALAKETAALAEVNENIYAEKDRFEAMRAQVNQEQDAAAKRLAEREQSVSLREDSVMQRESIIAGREKEASQKLAKAALTVNDMHAVLQRCGLLAS